jgi:hypothetical protein
MSAYQALLRYAIALNNTSVALLYRGHCNDAIEAIKYACAIVKIVVSLSEDAEHPKLALVSNETVVRVVELYNLGMNRIVSTESDHGMNEDIANQVHAIVLNEYEISKFATHEKITPKGSLNPIHLEFAELDSINFEFLLSIQLYNFAVIHFRLFRWKRMTSSLTTTELTADLTKAPTLVRHSYSIFQQCGVFHDSCIRPKQHLQIHGLILHGMILVLQENSMNAQECIDFQDLFAIIAHQVEVIEKSTTKHFLEKPAAAA